MALAAVHPHLDADDAVGGVGILDAVVDIRLERVQRQPPLLVAQRFVEIANARGRPADPIDSARMEAIVRAECGSGTSSDSP